jgi:diguanylate cyclase (GGDEF)-like protein/putative nucleotidyltransferase with HDIG domain
VNKLSLYSKAYIFTILAAGTMVVTHAFSSWESSDAVRFGCYLMMTLLASGLKVTLPGITGTLSVSYVFILLGVADLKPSETVVIACSAVLAQTYWHAKKRPAPIQALFNISSIAIATASACLAYRAHTYGGGESYAELFLGASACTYFLVNTLSIAGVVSLTERKNLAQLWRECYFWSFPYYLLGASIAGVVSRSNRYFGWQSSLLILPVLYVIYRSYALYLARLEDEKKHAQSEKKHAEAMAALHLRTIQAMALAIEAKDNTTHQHLERVQVYAVALGQELGISESELEALRAAAILHDIGKLAVPEHIISKPGKLTPEEFEKMKIHPVVGAEILERVEFPYPVAPIVRAHHERWDGSGYPYGLAGEEIPMGARILAAVDCLDALASDRQYRRALPLDEAMQIVADGAGKSFDSRVVEVLQRRCCELEQAARAVAAEHGTLESPKILKGEAPAAGFEKAAAGAARQPDFLLSIAAAREEMQALYELTTDLGNSLSLRQTLSVLDARLKPMIPYDAMAVYMQRGEHLMPEYVQGEDFPLFSSLEIPVGEGLSGWVAQNSKPIVNGDPSVEPSYLNDPAKRSTMLAGLAVPLEGINGPLGVLTLYSRTRDAFSRDHLRVLLAISSKASLAIENALRHHQAEMSATIDGLTGLPNARSLFLKLDSELSRCRRDNTTLGILVCDLDGFKQVNDRFGHLEGNKVLKLVAQGLVENCREYDYVARMGGDEFVMILPGIRPETVQKRAADLNKMVRRVGFEVTGEELLSISIGDAYYTLHGTDAEQLLAHADRRMYKVKQENKMMTAEQRSLLEIQALSSAIQ